MVNDNQWWMGQSVNENNCVLAGELSVLEPVSPPYDGGIQTWWRGLWLIREAWGFKTLGCTLQWLVRPLFPCCLPLVENPTRRQPTAGWNSPHQTLTVMIGMIQGDQWIKWRVIWWMLRWSMIFPTQRELGDDKIGQIRPKNTENGTIWPQFDLHNHRKHQQWTQELDGTAQLNTEDDIDPVRVRRWAR